MKVLLVLLVFGCVCVSTCKDADPTANGRLLLGHWEGLDEQGKIAVLLTMEPSELVIVHGENGESTRHAYSQRDGVEGKEILIEGFEERLIVNFADDDTLNLDLTDADSRKPAAPVISMVTYHRKR